MNRHNGAHTHIPSGFCTHKTALKALAGFICTVLFMCTDAHKVTDHLCSDSHSTTHAWCHQQQPITAQIHHDLSKVKSLRSGFINMHDMGYSHNTLVTPEESDFIKTTALFKKHFSFFFQNIFILKVTCFIKGKTKSKCYIWVSQSLTQNSTSFI